MISFGRGDIKLQLMLSEHFEILRRVTSIICTSLLSVFVIGRHVQNRTTKILDETGHQYLQFKRPKQDTWMMNLDKVAKPLFN